MARCTSIAAPLYAQPVQKLMCTRPPLLSSSIEASLDACKRGRGWCCGACVEDLSIGVLFDD